MRTRLWLALCIAGAACADPEELTKSEDTGARIDTGVTVIPTYPDASADGGSVDATQDATIDDASLDSAFPDASPIMDAEIMDAEIMDVDPPDTGTSSVAWNPATVTATAGQETPCTSSGFVRWSPRYQKWIAVSLCTATRYKIFLGEQETGPFYSIGDFAGSGQDHCELVNPAFTIPNEDDITSGGCATCALGPYINPVGTRGYSRPRFGDPFTYEPVWPMFNLYTPIWYECGIALP